MLSSKAIIRGSSVLRKMPQLQAVAGMRIASRQFSSVRVSHRPQFTIPVRAALPLTTLRFGSTTTTLPTPAAVAAAQEAGTIPAHTLDEHALPDYIPTVESLTENITNPEHIGYLKSIGLDYGWGPTSMLQYLLEHVHILTDTPWWASIVITVAVIRIAQFPFYMRMSETAARMKELNPQTVPITKKMREAQLRNDRMGMMMGKQQITEIYRSAGVNRLWLGFPITQAPIFFGFYKNMSGMAELKVPSLVEGGKFWFQDLTLCDPYYILPFVSSLSMGLQIYLGGEAGTTMQTKRVKQGMLIFLPLISFSVVHSWPAALTLYFFTNSMFGLMQATALRNPLVREKLGLYPLSPIAARNPLRSGEAGLKALNIATRPGPPGKIIDVGAPKQIGAKGGLLDRITGGNVNKDGTKKTLADYILGEKEKTEVGGFGQLWQDSNDKAKYTKYEEKREKRLKKEAEEEAARRKRVLGRKP